MKPTLLIWTCVAILSGREAYGQARPDPVGSPSGRLEELGCAPTLAWSEPRQPVRLVGSEEGVAQRMYGPGDALVLDAGINRQLQTGDRFFVRRLVQPVATRGARGRTPFLRHTAGWIRIVAIEEQAAVATVEHACDGLLQGDFLEPFREPEIPNVGASGEPDYDSAGVVLFGQDGSGTIGAGQFMVISRGSDHGAQPGQRVTLFREGFGSTGPVTEVGDGVIVAVAPDWATVRVLWLRDAVNTGDPVALQRP